MLANVLVLRSDARTVAAVGARGYKNHVFSDTLRQLERDCNRVCEVPVPRIQKVTVLGSGSPVGMVAGFMLKQQPLVRRLALYDECASVLGAATDIAHIDTSSAVEAYQVTVLGSGSPVGMVAGFMLKQQPLVRRLALYDECASVLGAATDIAHIDTSSAVEAYQGQKYLCPALHGADVVLVCGGEGSAGAAGAPERDAFAANARWVRGCVMAVAQFAPDAVLAIQTPPVDANFSLAMHMLQQLYKFDRRRLVGVNAPSAMRASQLAGTPGARTAVLCGAGRCTRVPLFGKLSNSSQSAECLTRLVREADEAVCRLKGGCGEAHLSVGFACARFVVEIMQGLFEGPRTGDSGVVLAGGEGGLRVRSGPLALGAAGVEGCAQPPLNELEKRLFAESECDMEDMLRLGRCYATNENYFTQPRKVYNSVLKKRQS